MIAKIAGWFWIITGIFFLLKPHLLKTRLQKQSLKKIRRYLFAITISLSALIMGAAFKSEGLLSKVIFGLGVFGVLKGFFFLKGKASEKVIEWYKTRSVKFFRISAAMQTLFRFILLRLH